MEIRDIESAFSQLVIVEPLRLGGQGWVYKARTAQEQYVALKIFDPTKVLAERVDREVAALRTLNCPFIVRLIDEGRRQVGDTTYRYTITEYIDGIDLRQRLQQDCVPPDEARSLCKHMARAIDALWDMRLVHRDIKPENILLDTEGQAVLIDLTIAKHVDRTTLTRYGLTFGTPGYMSPEHASGRKALTQKSDIFALGVVLAESLTGDHPFVRAQDRIGSAAPLGLDEIFALDGELGRLVEGMLQTSPMRRPSTREILGVLS